jgi:hypothetical protein
MILVSPFASATIPGLDEDTRLSDHGAPLSPPDEPRPAERWGEEPCVLSHVDYHQGRNDRHSARGHAVVRMVRVFEKARHQATLQLPSTPQRRGGCGATKEGFVNGGTIRFLETKTSQQPRRHRPSFRCLDCIASVEYTRCCAKVNDDSERKV